MTLVLLSAAPLAAQVQPDPCSGTLANPTDASFALSVKDGQTVFREGEILGLSLAFTSTTPGKYSLNTRNYDRSGRLNAETFCLEPTQGRDPLDDYFLSGLTGFIGGGIGGSQPLTAAAATVQIELNEWKALPAGRYRLRLVSSRVERRAGAGEPGSGIINTPLRSNTVEFEIVAATPEWQVERLAAALKAVDSGPSEDSKKQGARMLRFLGSEAAARELARRYWSLNDQPFGWEFMFGLVASSHRQTAIDAMKAAIADPLHPITREFIDTLSLLEIQTKAEYRLPPYSEADRAAWMSRRDLKAEAYRGTVERYTAELAGALGAKTGTALAVSINALLTAPTTSSDRTNLQQMLLASWDSLPARTRNELIAYRWDQIGGPGMLPILRRIVNTAPSPGRPEQLDRGPALARLYELSPGEGREFMLREILNTRGDIGMQVLGRLPDRDLPEVEGPISAKLVNGSGTYIDFQLLERYATAKPLPEVKTLYERTSGRWACEPQTAMLRYFLRVDRTYGVAQVVKALGQRQATGCYQFLLSDLKEALAIPELERLAISALDDPSPGVARNAAEALGRFGSAAAENALWTRLEKFQALWKDRRDELRLGPGGSGLAAEGMIEYALINALSRGEAWVSGTEKLERLKGMVSPWRQTELAGSLADWQRAQFTLSMNWLPDGRFRYNVGAYSGESVDQLARKLRQFPSGTQITLTLSPEVEERHRAEVATVRQAAEAAGAVLEIRR